MANPVRKRHGRLLSALLGLSLVLGACDLGGAPPLTPVGPAPTATPAPVDYGVPKNPQIAALGPVDLHVLFAADYYNTKPVVAVAQAFMQMYPNITITLEGPTPWAEIPARLKTARAGGSMSIDLAHQHAFVMGAQGYAEPIDALWTQIDESALMPGAIEDVIWKGVHYGVPLDINCLFTIYRKDLFQKEGIPEPGPNWTYTEAREAARRLTRGDVYGAVIHNSSWNISGHIRANGGVLLAGDGQTVTLDAGPNIEIAEFLSDMINVDRSSPVPMAAGQPYAPVEVFWAGKAAIFWSGPWDLGRLRDDAPASFKAICPNLSCIGTASMPHGLRGNATGSVQGGGSLFIPKGSKHKEVAFELMRWYLTPAYQLAMVADQARFPVLKALYSRPDLADDTLARPFYEQLVSAHPYTLAANPTADQAWSQAVAAILAGAPAADTLHAAQIKARAALDNAP